MEQRPPRATKKDRTGAWISITVHAVLIGVVLYLVARTERVQQWLGYGIGATRDDKKKPTDKPKPPPTKSTAKAAPKAGADAPAQGGSRRRSVVDAPPAAGEGLAVEERKETKDAAARRSSESDLLARATRPPPPKPLPAPKLFTTAALKSDIKSLMVERAKAAASTEAIGSEQISKSGISDAGEIVTKVSGATIADGKFPVVRGLSDRYVLSTLNGAEVPSADPYRRSASLDLFPAQIIDQVVVTKTYTADQPGSATAGGINIVTKSFPERPFLTASVGASYNLQSSFNDKFLSYDGGSLDFLGIDDGTRALPGALSQKGLSLPIAAVTTSGLPSSSRYLQNIADAEAQDRLTRAMGPTEFAPTAEQSLLNHNFSTAFGDTVFMAGRPLGYFAGLTYARNFSHYDDGKRIRYSPDGSGGQELDKDFDDARSIAEVNWAGMVTLAWEPLPSQELGFSFLYNQNAEDLARAQSGTVEGFDNYIYRLFRLHFTERNLQTYQLRGGHSFTELANLRVDWLGALSLTSQQEPDVRFFHDIAVTDPGTGDVVGYLVSDTSNPTPIDPTRYFRDLDEENKNLKLDLTLPFRQWHAEEGLVKVGGFYSGSERTFLDREVLYKLEGSDPPYNGDPNAYLLPNNLGWAAPPVTNAANGRINYTWNRHIGVRNSSYEADSTINAGYLMVDTPLLTPLRLVAGARYETTDLSVHSESYQTHSLTGRTTNSSDLVQTDLLPSVGLMLSLSTNMALRLGWSQTLARPSFRELAAYRGYDPTTDEIAEGNPNLTMTSIVNYDFRWEWFPRAGELLAVSLFYKDLTDAIEKGFIDVNGDVITWFNRPDAQVYGVEFEFRTAFDFIDPLLKDFSMGGNFAIMESVAKLTPTELSNKQTYDPGSDDSRPLYDQSPYIINLDFNYDNRYSGTSASLIYNVAGPRVAIAKLDSEDIYEQPSGYLDFVLSQRIGRHLRVRLSARNLLDPKVERTYGIEGKLPYSSYRRGRSFGLSLAYDF